LLDAIQVNKTGKVTTPQQNHCRPPLKSLFSDNRKAYVGCWGRGAFRGYYLPTVWAIIGEGRIKREKGSLAMPPIDLVRIEQENSAGVDRKMQSGILHNIIESASRHIEGQIRVYTFCGVGEEYARSIDQCSVPGSQH
jgi:hypothetical protein